VTQKLDIESGSPGSPGSPGQNPNALSTKLPVRLICTTSFFPIFLIRVKIGQSLS